MHPQVIEGSKRVIGFAPDAANTPMYAWDELYPDGTVRTFGEVWRVVTAASGTRYGGTDVVSMSAS